MMKKPFVISIILVLIILLSVSYSFAEERIILTTYYPAPYGVYKEMRADQMTIGSAYRNAPVSNGRLFVSESVGIGITSPDTPLTFAGSIGQKIHLYGTQANGYVLGVESNDLRIAGGTGGSDYISFRTGGYNGTERMRIVNNGYIGIGTTNPAYRFDVSGDSAFRGTIHTGIGGGDASVELGGIGTGNRNVYIDFHSDNTYTDYGLRIIRYGSSGISNILARGTSNFVIGTQDAAPLIFNTNNTTRATIDSSGNIAATGNIDADGSIWAQDGLETQTNLTVEGNGAIEGKLGVGTNNPVPQFHVDATSTPWDDIKGLAQFQDNYDRVIAIGGMGMFRRDYNSDNGDLRINYIGYLGSTTRFRDFGVYDGKGSLILNVDGSEREVDVASDANFSKAGDPIVQCNWNGRRNYQDAASQNDFGIVCKNGVILWWCHWNGGGPASYQEGVYDCN